MEEDFLDLVYELQVLMYIRSVNVWVQSQTIIIFVLWMLCNQLLVANLSLIIRINVDPFICHPFDAMSDHAASVQSILILLSDPT